MIVVDYLVFDLLVIKLSDVTRKIKDDPRERSVTTLYVSILSFI